MIYALFFGLIFAFGLILPLGPQNIFVINQGAQNRNVFAVGVVILTAALCDTLLILLSVWGVGVAVLKIVWIKYAMLSVGIAFLVYLGVRAWRSHTSELTTEAPVEFSFKKLVGMTMAVSLLNPAAWIDTIITIGSASLVFAGAERAAFTTGCILTSWLWFIFLAIAGKQLQRVAIINRNLNKISAVLMWFAASYLVYQLLTV